MRVPSPNYHSPRPVAGLFHFGGMESACALLREAAPLPWTSASHRSRPHHFPGAGVFCQHDLTSPAPAGLFHSAESVSDVQPNRDGDLIGYGPGDDGVKAPAPGKWWGWSRHPRPGRGAQLQCANISTLRHPASAMIFFVGTKVRFIEKYRPPQVELCGRLGDEVDQAAW
jgi:hypothetical protein